MIFSLDHTENTDSTNENSPRHSIRMYWTNFQQPTAPVNQNIFEKILIEVCCLHLTILFTPKLVNYSRPSEPLKYVLKSTISCLRRKMSSIFEFFGMFKDSLWREYLTNFSAKGAKRSVKMWAINFCLIFSKNILLYRSRRWSKIRSVHTYAMPCTVFIGCICTQCTPKYFWKKSDKRL